MYSKDQIKAAFLVPPEFRSEEQMAICEYQLPVLQGDATAEYEAMLVDRFQRGLPMSLDGKRRARKILRQRA